MARFDWKNAPESAWKKALSKDPIARWDKALDNLPPSPDAIRLGTSVSTSSKIYLQPKELSTHMHIVGATGVGKSFFLEGIIKRLIEQGHGICLITPHEDIYERVIDYCAVVHRARPELGLSRRVIPFDLSNTRQIMGFNPVARNARVMSYQVVALMDAIRKCWGQANFQETPRLARWLFNTGFAVVESKLTLLQARHLVDSKPTPIRQAIVGRLQDDDIRREWQWIMAQKTREQDERLESSFNRIREFVGHELIRLVIGQHTKTIDFPSVLREGKILLVNLSRAGTMAENNQHLIGTLLVNELLTAAFARRQGERKPFFLCIDEFQHFATKDICEILDGGRKFGLHLILAHQLLNQLRAKEPEVYYSTLTNARTKVVFGGLIDEDLEILGKELFTGELDPDQVKDEIWQTKYEPVEATRVIASDSYSESESEAEADSYGEVNHESIARADCYIPGSYLLSGPTGQLPSQSTFSSGSGISQSSSSSRSSSYSSSRGSSISEVPWYEYHAYKELSSRTFRSLEEQLYMKKAQLKRQPLQHAAILRPDSRVELVKAPTLANFSNSLREEFLAECFESAGCFKSPAEAEREVVALEESLLLPAPITIITGQGSNDDDAGEFFESSRAKL